MSDLKCLEKIIGLSRNECSCYENDRPEDFNESNSGLFLDELEGLELNILSGDEDCGDGNIWERMERAVENSKNAFRTDVLAAISQETKNKRKAVLGNIGELGYKTFINPIKTYYGVKFSKNDIKGGEFTLKGISTLMDSTVMFDVEIWNNLSDAPLLVLPNINAVAGTWTDNVLAPDPILTFPLYDENCEELSYYIVYTPIGFKPANNNCSCGCSRRPEWEKWIDCYGVYGDDMTEADRFQTNGIAHGLRLNIQFNCNNAHVICGGENSDFDFDNDPIARVIANAIRFRAGEMLIEDILASGQINRYTLLDKERLWGKRNHYRAEYSQRILYLQSEIDVTTNDCYKCSDNSINKGAILS